MWNATVTARPIVQNVQEDSLCWNQCSCKVPQMSSRTASCTDLVSLGWHIAVKTNGPVPVRQQLHFHYCRFQQKGPALNNNHYKTFPTTLLRAQTQVRKQSTCSFDTLQLYKNIQRCNLVQTLALHLLPVAALESIHDFQYSELLQLTGAAPKVS